MFFRALLSVAACRSVAQRVVATLAAAVPQRERVYLCVLSFHVQQRTSSAQSMRRFSRVLFFFAKHHHFIHSFPDSLSPSELPHHARHTTHPTSAAQRSLRQSALPQADIRQLQSSSWSLVVRQRCELWQTLVESLLFHNASGCCLGSRQVDGPRHGELHSRRHPHVSCQRFAKVWLEQILGFVWRVTANPQRGPRHWCARRRR